MQQKEESKSKHFKKLFSFSPSLEETVLLSVVAFLFTLSKH